MLAKNMNMVGDIALEIAYLFDTIFTSFPDFKIKSEVNPIPVKTFSRDSS
jgi:hypothetical protein